MSAVPHRWSYGTRSLDLNAEPAAVRDRYGRMPFGQNLFLARRLIEAGTRLATVNAWPGYPEKDKYPHFTQGWDKPVSPEDFSATIFVPLGIPPETRYGRDGFSKRVSAGQSIRELFG
jgi:hypothetical protein